MIKTGDRVRIKDRPDWPGKYRLANSEGTVVGLKEDAGFVTIHLEKTTCDVERGVALSFRIDAVEKI